MTQQFHPWVYIWKNNNNNNINLKRHLYSDVQISIIDNGQDVEAT